VAGERTSPGKSLYERAVVHGGDPGTRPPCTETVDGVEDGVRARGRSFWPVGSTAQWNNRSSGAPQRMTPGSTRKWLTRGGADRAARGGNVDWAEKRGWTAHAAY
jgi:hypothetical protein